jgi:hypothetical protein
MDQSRTARRGPQIGSCELGSGWSVVIGAVLAGICAHVVVVGVLDVREAR